MRFPQMTTYFDRNVQFHKKHAKMLLLCMSTHRKMLFSGSFLYCICSLPKIWWKISNSWPFFHLRDMFAVCMYVQCSFENHNKWHQATTWSKMKHKIPVSRRMQDNSKRDCSIAFVDCCYNENREYLCVELRLLCAQQKRRKVVAWRRTYKHNNRYFPPSCTIPQSKCWKHTRVEQRNESLWKYINGFIAREHYQDQAAAAAANDAIW